MDPRPATSTTAFAVVLVAVGVAVAVLLAPGLFFARRSTTGTMALEGMFIGVAAATAGLALVRGRARADAHARLVGAGLVALVVQSLIAGVGANLWDNSPWEGFAFPSHAWQLGWLVAAGCFILAVRRPAWATRLGGWTVLAALAGLAVADLALIAGRFRLTRLSDSLLVDGSPAPFERTSGLHWVFGAAIVAALLWAAFGEATASSARRDPHACLSAAWIVAAGVQVMFVAYPSAFRPIFQGGNVLQLASVVVALAGYLLATRTDPLAGARNGSGSDGDRARVAAMASHELRTPITSIRGLAATGTRMYESLSDEERRDFFRLIDEESRRLSEVAEETSIALKLDAGSVRYDFRASSIGEVVGSAARDAPVGEHPVQVDAEPDVLAVVDAARLGEVVRELVVNAAKFSPAGAPITVRAYARGAGAVIEVADRGPGIPPEHRAEVFEPFVTARPSGYEEAPGPGLGLFIARAHVLEHGGRIEVEDGPDGGTMLRVTIPRERGTR